MPESLLQLLEDGFADSYVPPIPDGVAEAQTAMVQSISQNSVSGQGKDQVSINDIVSSFKDYADRAGSIVTALKDVANASASAIDSRGISIVLPSADEYITLISSSPDLDSVDKMRLYESYHTGLVGNLDVFVYEEALTLQADMLSTLSHQALNDLVASNVTGIVGKIDPLDPQTTMLDYYRAKQQASEVSIVSLENTTVMDGASGANFLTAEQLGQNTSINNKLDSILASDRALLVTVYRGLQVLYYMHQPNIAGVLKEAKSYAKSLPMRLYNAAMVSAATKVYSEVTAPLHSLLQSFSTTGVSALSVILHATLHAGPLTAKIGISDSDVNAATNKIFQSVFKQIKKFQNYITQLTKADHEFHAQSVKKLVLIGQGKQIKSAMNTVLKMIKAIDTIEASGNTAQYLADRLGKSITPELQKLTAPIGTILGNNGVTLTGSVQAPNIFNIPTITASASDTKIVPDIKIVPGVKI